MKQAKFVDYVSDLHREYGPIVAIKAGVQRLVFINDGKLLSELFQREEFSYRPLETLPWFVKRNKGNPRGGYFVNNLKTDCVFFAFKSDFLVVE